VALVATVALYASVAVGIVRQWFDDPNNAHGIFLAAASLFVLRRSFPSLIDLPVAPRNWGFVVLSAGLLTYLAGTITGDVFLLRVSAPIVGSGAIIALWGYRHLRALFPALALLTLAIPLPAVLLTRLTMPLQLMASQVAAGALTLSHVPVARDGNLLTLSNITLEVAEACNGLRSVVSLISMAAICGAIIPLSARRTAMLVAAAIPVAVVGNGLRVAATGVMALSMGDVAVNGVVHEITGFVAFAGMCVATLMLLRMTQGRTLRWARLHR
jgi:exosortase